ncbi:MAG: FAD-dependent oxidoreductase [Candidatus Bipolaricaulota bacterium]|nr:FAD-dependent oxidoreductase [Candidatus Bipolaricaulota bacterium]MDW8151815.1 FAD-dependent oxidoreductase [Candidatus Bipolaricaulota bacterium]
MVTFSLDGKRVTGEAGETILQAARRAGVDIPALCADPRLPPFDACGVCVVEVEGKGVVKACSTPIAEGMVVRTRTPAAEEVRRSALELLLSAHWGDCIAPCQLHCPQHTDCQGYVGLTANGLYLEGLKLLYEKLPLPATLGRICPAPCEDACRRQIVEEPIQIRRIKRFLGELGLDYVPPVGPATGFRVAVVGSGPAGLSAAYFLRRQGHAVVVFEARERLGGMLRYGIPVFRLPHEVLDREIEVLRRMGIEFRTGVALGRDLTLADLERDFHAVFLGLGAWKSRRLGIPGEDHPAVLQGLEFLAQVKTGQPPRLPGRVAVIGGGNTAMDAARTARRLGAEVVVIYRRGREEMPAEPEEVQEAEEEGVRFEFLAQPLAFLPAGERLQGVRCQRMQLSEPDASGRRRPVPVPGAEFVVPVEAAIVAVGQEPDFPFLAEMGLALNKDGTIQADPETGQTNRPKVFAGGDAVTGPGIAIEAIAAGYRAALAIDRLLRGLPLRVPEPYVHTKAEVRREELGEVAEARRVQPRRRPAEERVRDFRPFEARYTRAQAEAEARRCLECGCSAAFTCLLRAYSGAAQARQDRYPGEVPKPLPDARHPFIVRDPAKCILCGRCVRVCDEICGVHAIDFVRRGFVAEIQAPFNAAWQDSDCVSCGACVETCPTGALYDRLALRKFVPLRAKEAETVCTLCGLACPMVVETLDGKFLRARAGGGGVLCAKGRYGWQVLLARARLTQPFLRRNGRLRPAPWEEALALLARHLSQRGTVLVLDPGLSAEEFRFWQGLAAELGAELRVAGADAGAWPLSLAGPEALATADLLLRPARLSRHEGFVLGLRLREASRRGAAVVALPQRADPARLPAELVERVRAAQAPLLVLEAPWADGLLREVAAALQRLHPQLRLFSPQGSLNPGLWAGLSGEPPRAARALVFVGAEIAGPWAVAARQARFVAAFSPWPPRAAPFLHALLPHGLPLEEGGTFGTAEGRTVRVAPVLPPPGGRSPGEVRAALARALGLREPAGAAVADPAEPHALRLPWASSLAQELLRRRGIAPFR